MDTFRAAVKELLNTAPEKEPATPTITPLADREKTIWDYLFSKLGNLLINNGILPLEFVNPADYDALKETISWLMENKNYCMELGTNGSSTSPAASSVLPVVVPSSPTTRALFSR